MNKTINTTQEDIKTFVSELHKGNKTPSDHFNMSHEELGEVEDKMFNTTEQESKWERF